MKLGKKVKITNGPVSGIIGRIIEEKQDGCKIKLDKEIEGCKYYIAREGEFEVIDEIFDMNKMRNDEYIFEQLERHIELQLQESAKCKVRYEGEIEAYGNVLNKIRALKKQKEDEKRRNDDFIDAMKYALGERGAT